MSVIASREPTRGSGRATRLADAAAAVERSPWERDVHDDCGRGCRPRVRALGLRCR
jgi:hypothetical protein